MPPLSHPAPWQEKDIVLAGLNGPSSLDNLSRRQGTNERSQVGTVAGVFVHERNLESIAKLRV